MDRYGAEGLRRVDPEEYTEGLPGARYCGGCEYVDVGRTTRWLGTAFQAEDGRNLFNHVEYMLRNCGTN